jgi:hypothetical protein
LHAELAKSKGEPMIEESRRSEAQSSERNGDHQDPRWEDFKVYVKKIAAVPKEELDEKLDIERREKERNRAG